jgi:hypothetical protein
MASPEICQVTDARPSEFTHTWPTVSRILNSSQGAPLPFGYADAFRVLGQLLDHQGAVDAEILVSELSITVRWRDAAGAEGVRSFDTVELSVLGDTARQDRVNSFGEMQGGWAAALRTLGQELEASRLDPLLIRSLAGGLQVYAQENGAPRPEWYDRDRLLEWNRVRRAQRMVAHLRRTAYQGGHWWERWREALPFASGRTR